MKSPLRWMRWLMSNRLRRTSAIPSAWLDEVRMAIRLDLYDEAEAMLVWISQFGPCACCSNLEGIIQEARGNNRLAYKFYRKALRLDPDHSPAMENMRRWYELHTFGRTNRPVTLGDERPALHRLLDATARAGRLESIPRHDTSKR